MGTTVGAVRQRNAGIDLLKGISIIAVVLYHMGLLKSGYLGVDSFFVLGGFLTMPKIVKGVSDGSFRYFTYLRSRVIRLLPAILIASILALAVGFVLWLPNDYENLSESVIASAFFSNNILSGITTKNYWDAINEYKPLMHMWYVGILMEYYILLPLCALVFKKLAGVIRKDPLKTELVGIGVITAVSFVLFLLPKFTAGDKFYFIPFRFWELLLGGIIGCFSQSLNGMLKKQGKVLSFVSFGMILLILCIGLINFDISKIGVNTTIIGADTVASSDLILPNPVLLIVMVLVTGVFLVTNGETPVLHKSRVLSAIGKRSFSIFVWHQVILALYRYSVTNQLSVWFVIGFFALLALVSEISYRLIENKIRNTAKTFVAFLLLAAIVCGYSGFIYFRAGVVRDVPELGITTADIRRNMHSKYCDRIYGYQDAFTDNGKLNVLVVGNSFARDWGNILLESEYGDHINLYFSSHFSESLTEQIKKADRIFLFENYEDKAPAYLWANTDKDKVYCIGTKNFGTCNGTIYVHRFSDDYFSQTVPLDSGYDALNQERRKTWGDHYVELIEPVLENGRVRVFTDDRMFISQDCRHLTEAGARYYAKILDLSQYMPALQ